jgi:hypothetical protein
MNRGKREQSKKKQEEDIQDLEEAIEDQMQIEDDERSASSEGDGEDLMDDMEK